MQTIARAALVDAASDINKVLDLDPAIDVKLGVKELRASIAEAANLLTDKDAISDATRSVVDALKSNSGAEDEQSSTDASAPPPASAAGKKASGKGKEAAAEKPKKEKIAKPSKPVQLGKFAAVRRDTALGKIVGAALAGKDTVAAVALASGVEMKKVLGVLKRARITNGIDHTVDDAGLLTIILPKGIDAESVWKMPKAATTRSISVEGSSRQKGKTPKPKDEFHPLREGTIRGNIFARMDGTRTVTEIADDLSLNRGNTSSHVFCLWRDCGIGFSFDDKKRVKAVLPSGVSSAFKAAA
jgi:hypothetical protein